MSMSDIALQSTDQSVLSVYLRDLEAAQLGVEKFALLSQTGSALEKAISLVVSVIDATKSAAMGLAWKAVVKVVPPIAVVYDSVIDMRNTIQRTTIPLATLRRILPLLTESLRAQQVSHVQPPELSGQLYAVASAMPEVSNGLKHLGALTENTCKAIRSLGNAVERLNPIKGVGPLAERLRDALVKLDVSLNETQVTIQEVSVMLDKTQGWLPEYQAQTRKRITANIACQAVEKSSLFKKELCQKPVLWFDDEASANCSVCRVTVCDQHRVAVSTPAGSTTRNTWLCLECAKKQRK
jgi:hypothetical protein